ncbi:acyltransferase [Tuanshanicoccus lijuaniae]|uniref:acyltransferase family protein n=1 Tax=Aerococcaceae bacterium zg-1292 TaxID=2774330 RepID=UPI001938FF8E|nr:acyltransferase [Aerococcaceae bacterium zg-1292]QQA36898.1 acyltransferase [Aerococcaceae bacterium zg-1292]
MSRQKRISSYDGLKGLSILAVIFYHMFQKQVPGGFLTVNTFFAIAGYFFARKIEQVTFNRQEQDWRALGKYVRSTLGRLFFPMFWMLGSIIVVLFIFNRDALYHIRSDLFSGMFFYNNLYQIAADKSYFARMTEASPFTHLWYSSLYLQMFVVGIIGSCLMKWLKLPGTAKAIIWGLVAFLSHSTLMFLYEPNADPSRVYYGLATRFSSFALGMMTTYMIPAILNATYNVKNKKALYTLIGLTSGLLFVYLPFVIEDQAPITYYIGLPFYSVLSMFVLFAIATGVPMIRKPLAFKPLVLLGQRSYSYYLWYYPVIVFWLQYRRFMADNQIYLLNIAMMVSIVVLSELTYQIIERRIYPIPFGQRFDWQADVQQVKHSHAAKGVAFAFLMMVVVVASGMIISRDDQTLARFNLEYQLQKNSPSMHEIANPTERYIARTLNQLQSYDKQLSSHFVEPLPAHDYVAEYQKSKEHVDLVDAQVTELAAEQQAVLDRIAEKNPDLAALVPVREQLYAAELPVSFFGDSLVLVSAPVAMDLFLNGNQWGIKNLQIWDAVDKLKQWISEGSVKPILVVNLGTNAGLDHQGMEDFIAAAGKREIFFVNSNSDVPHKMEVNEIIHEFAKKYKNVHEVDWYTYAVDHPEYYWEGEGVHHTPEGANHFAAFIAHVLYETLAGEQ